MMAYYEDDAITIYHGDCRDVLPTLGAVDHVVTDPPYSEETHTGARSAAKPQTINGARPLGVEGGEVGKFAECPPSGLRFVRFGVWVKPDGAPQFTGDRPGQGCEPWQSCTGETRCAGTDTVSGQSGLTIARSAG